MPSWDSEDGVGEIISLPRSMKNGSLANNSKMKIETHIGTHVDAPGHVFDRYFDLGFDVDTLDLYVLNGELEPKGDRGSTIAPKKRERRSCDC
ncbi:hypothetical protein CTI12_AA491270 [Artemisia annua]|uniref:Cyclase family protein n=1 Tax=Artemisia annua TaxID=35608 RepID=A0A2U1LHF1_ARTAN|nr:hypothetical protein CTI12_AA491270 [Artemisia annua]